MSALSMAHDMMLQKPRILIAPIEIAGQYRNLAIAIRAHGRQCDYYTFYPHSFGYGSDLGSCPIPRAMRWIHTFGKAGSRPARCISIVAFELLRVAFFLYALAKYDAFIFGYGLSLLRCNHDLFLLKLFGKRVIANMSHGSDMTPDFLDGALLDKDGIMPAPRRLVAATRSKLKTIRRFEKYASVIIGSPLSSSYLAKQPFVNIFAIGRVCQANAKLKTIKVAQAKIDRNVRLLHVPSHAPGKGTPVIEAAIASLQRKGYQIQYKRLSGVPNSEVLEAIDECDLVVDQLYADLPMSGLACEAAYLGKPSLLGGYELLDLRQVVPSSWLPPTCICDPSRLEDELQRLICDPSLLLAKGQELLDFVTTQWNPVAVSTRYLTLIDSHPIPDEWFHDPRSMSNRYGYGLSIERVKSSIRQIVTCFGVSGLCLQHRPALQLSLCALAGVDPAETQVFADDHS